MTEKPKTPPVVAPAAPLARASESTDPAVHALLAERQTHLMNQTTAEATNDSEAAEEAAGLVKDVNRRLAELGYE